MVSSSCSYAASAMAKSLFAKGADYIAAMVFMFASTNLVIELGIVLVVLMGWQFAVSEFVGGIIMIVLLATLGALWLRGRVVVQARAAGAGRATAPTSTSTVPRATSQRCHGPARARSLGRMGRQRHLHHVRPHHAPPRAGHRLHGGGVPRRPRADLGLAGGLHHRPRLLDQRRERARRAVHRGHQLRLLHRQRAAWRRRSGRAASPSAA